MAQTTLFNFFNSNQPSSLIPSEATSVTLHTESVIYFECFIIINFLVLVKVINFVRLCRSENNLSKEFSQSSSASMLQELCMFLELDFFGIYFFVLFLLYCKCINLSV